MSEEKTRPPEWVARQKTENHFDGLNPKTLANLNSQGLGPKPYKRDRLVFYRYEDLVTFVRGK
jgi:hypothetical protein